MHSLYVKICVRYALHYRAIIFVPNIIERTDTMRKFRTVPENLRDTRIAYTFLLSLALISLLLGVAVTRLDSTLHERELDGYYEALTLCADALEEWGAAEGADTRYGAALRFERAAAMLPSEVELEGVMSLVDYMQMGDTSAPRVRAYADTFLLLSSLDFATEDEARRVICDALLGVSEALDGVDVIQTKPLPPETVAYTQNIVKDNMKGLLGGALRSLEPEFVEDGNVWRAEASNVRLDYSAADGGLEGFVYIRLGDVPEWTVDADGCAERALAFYKSSRKGTGRVSVSVLTSSCGFTLCEIRDGDTVWHSAVDSHGRVWSLIRAEG